MKLPGRQPPAPMPHATDVFTHFRRRWYCLPPASRAQRFRVTECEWDDRLEVQDVYAWEPVPE